PHPVVSSVDVLQWRLEVLVSEDEHSVRDPLARLPALVALGRADVGSNLFEHVIDRRSSRKIDTRKARDHGALPQRSLAPTERNVLAPIHRAPPCDRIAAFGKRLPRLFFHGMLDRIQRGLRLFRDPPTGDPVEQPGLPTPDRVVMAELYSRACLAL